jgi:hypothetical protein
MTLHVAMEEVLKDEGRPMSALMLAAEINRRGLYHRSDGYEVPSGQILVNRAQYQDRFVLIDGLISLRV